MNRQFDVTVLGAGAAGLMCAIEAGKRGRRVVVLERNQKPGKKILISGGGRCNFTNLHCRPENFLSANPHFAKSALARYTPSDFLGLLKKHDIPYHEKTLGQLFCDRSAADILDMLLEECRSAGVTLVSNIAVRAVSSGYTVATTEGEFQSPALVVATGGLSIPKMGATALGYQIARQFGLKVVDPRPGLVPLTLEEGELTRYQELSGVSTEVVVSHAGRRFREKMLFTHRGLSGPAILQISSYWSEGKAIEIDLAPGVDATAELRGGTGTRHVAAAKASLQAILPKRLAHRWLEHNAPEKWTNQDLARLEQRLHAWQVMPAGTEGFGKAEVTAGGVDTDDLSAKTMECKKASGLYFIGEVVDVTGQLGGFNFQWAWASGAAAGRAV